MYVYTPKENPMYTKLSVVVATTAAIVSVIVGWDSDGYYLRQALLVSSGLWAGVVVMLINTKEAT